MLRWLIFLLFLSCLPASSQDFDAACRQQQVVYAKLNAYHFSPPIFDPYVNLQVVDLFSKEVDERNTLLLQEDIVLFRNIALTATEPQVFCKLVQLTYRVLTRRVNQLDSIVTTVEKLPLDFTKADTIIFVHAHNERLYCSSLSELRHRVEKRIRYEALTVICNPTKTASPTPKEIQEMAARSKQKSIRRLRHFIDGLKPGLPLLKHISNCMSNAVAQRFDPHSNFFDPSQLENYQEELSTEASSFGFSVNEDEAGNIIVDQLVPGGPAWKSNNLNEKDIILSFRFDGEEEMTLDNIDLDDFYTRFKETSSKTMTLVVRKKDFKTVSVSLKKEKIQSQENVLNSYVITLGGRKFGYIPIPSFYLDQETERGQGCANDVAKEVVELKRDSVTGVIIDLRYNGGGSMDEAIGLAGIFIDEGPVAIYKPREGKPFLLKDKNRGSIWDGPLIVMVNSASASASEFVTATLQDYNRALVVGSTTFGKGSAQNLEPADSVIAGHGHETPVEGYLKITTGKFYRLTGESHQAKGIRPDIVLPGLIEMVVDKESDYPWHLPCDSVDKKATYQKLPELPKLELLRLSNERINRGHFAQIKLLGDSLKITRHYEDKVPLTVAAFKKYSYSRVNFNNKVERLFTDQSPVALTIRANSENQKIFSLSEYQLKNNEQAIEELKKDISLRECVNILDDILTVSHK